MKKYLISGGAGFIGSHLTESLLADGHEVTVLDDLSTGRLQNLNAVLNHPNFRFVHGSVENGADLGALVAWADMVFHLAAAVGVDLVVKHPVRTIETNTHGTENVLKHAALSGTRVLIASTSEVYGRATNAVFRETDDLVIGAPTHSRWSYAASKALDEFLALAYHKEMKLSTTVVRFFNTVGPRQIGRYGMVLPRFVKQALANEPVRVFGDGEQTRCFCHVQDVVRALMALDRAEHTAGQIFNIGTTTSISINNLAKRVIALCDSHSEIVHIPYSDAYEPGFEDMRRRMPDTSKLEALTGWQWQKTLDEIIVEVRAYLETKA
jgi:UDP-glucose 4-epimerase